MENELIDLFSNKSWFYIKFITEIYSMDYNKIINPLTYSTSIKRTCIELQSAARVEFIIENQMAQAFLAMMDTIYSVIIQDAAAMVIFPP